ncbi:MAG: hypothetical protein Q8O59_04675 [bacterium]|nr:hypothetical protein [bacterium]
MDKSNAKKQIIVYAGLFYIIFFIIPYLFLKFSLLIKDFGWYLLYFIFILPIIFIIYIIIQKFSLSKLFINYRKEIITQVIIFILIYLATLGYLYYLIINAFGKVRFPF